MVFHGPANGAIDHSTTRRQHTLFPETVRANQPAVKVLQKYAVALYLINSQSTVMRVAAMVPVTSAPCVPFRSNVLKVNVPV